MSNFRYIWVCLSEAKWKPNAQANPPVSTSGCCHNACSAQGAKIACLYAAAAAKSYCEDNPFQRIVAFG